MSVDSKAFISPEYFDAWENIRPYEDSPRVFKGDYKRDSNDNFPDWMSENTLKHTHDDNSTFSGTLLSEEGVLCRISHQVQRKWDSPGIHRHADFSAWGPYRRVVGITFTPSTRGLPKEIQIELEKRGYVPKTEENSKGYCSRGRFG